MGKNISEIMKQGDEAVMKELGVETIEQVFDLMNDKSCDHPLILELRAFQEYIRYKNAQENFLDEKDDRFILNCDNEAVTDNN